MCCSLYDVDQNCHGLNLQKWTVFLLDHLIGHHFDWTVRNVKLSELAEFFIFEHKMWANLSE